MDRIDEKIILEDNYKIYLSEITKIPLLTKEEEQQLLKEIKTSNVAKEKLMMANLRFVIQIAKKYKKDNISLMDLIQEGNLGLQFAIENYDVTKNVRFLTYAYYYIRKFIINYLNAKRRLIRLPEEVIEDIYRYKKTVSRLMKEYQRLPSFLEIANSMKISEKKVKRIYFLLEEPSSFNEILKKENNRNKVTEKSYFIKNNVDLEEEILKNDFNNHVHYLIENSNLTENEIKIIKEHYGINCPKKTFKEIAYELNVTPQAVHFAHNRAIKKLFLSKNLNCLDNYIDEKQLRK